MTRPMMDLQRIVGDPLALTVNVVEVAASDDEALRGIGAVLGEVLINGIPVYGHRLLVHNSLSFSGVARARCKEETVARFAHAVRDALGYDYKAAHGG